jgi:hypothetical protein
VSGSPGKCRKCRIVVLGSAWPKNSDIRVRPVPNSSSSIADLLHVTRVWYPYDANAPSSARPDWVPCEQWGTTLFVNSASEPAATDVIHLWYQCLCTLSGLDGASTTTIPADAENLIVTGAVGYVTEERIMEEPATRWRIPRALKEWGIARLPDFDKGLEAYARRQAAQHAGIAQLPQMDRRNGVGSDPGW